MAELGNWSNHDNKKYIGKLDRIYVSMTEAYEVEYFIDHYLQTLSFDRSNSNRDIVTAALEAYQGTKPYKRDDLNKFLDSRFKK